MCEGGGWWVAGLREDGGGRRRAGGRWLEGGRWREEDGRLLRGREREGLPVPPVPFAAACFAYSAAASPVHSIASLAFTAACFEYSAVVPAAPAVASLALAAACLM